MLRCSQCDANNQDDVLFCNQCRLFLGSLGDYGLIRQVAEGGFGEIFEGSNFRTGYPVAIKIMHKHLSKDPPLQKRFQREAKILQEIQHPHIVRIFAQGENPELGLFLVMEWLAGQNLYTWSKTNKTLPLPPSQALALFVQLLDGLERIHSQGIVHRDLKPSNIMLLQEGPLKVIKLLDFGLAKYENASQPLTKSNATLGTPHYMAPEQIDHRFGNIGPTTDLYAAGLTLLWLLTGKLPFSGTTPQRTMFQQCSQPAPLLRELHPALTSEVELEKAISRSLAKQPQQRYSSAREFADTLQPIISALQEQKENHSHISSLWPKSAQIPTHKNTEQPHKYNPKQHPSPQNTDNSYTNPKHEVDFSPITFPPSLETTPSNQTPLRVHPPKKTPQTQKIPFRLPPITNPPAKKPLRTFLWLLFFSALPTGGFLVGTLSQQKSAPHTTKNHTTPQNETNPKTPPKKTTHTPKRRSNHKKSPSMKNIISPQKTNVTTLKSLFNSIERGLKKQKTKLVASLLRRAVQMRPKHARPYYYKAQLAILQGQCLRQPIPTNKGACHKALKALSRCIQLAKKNTSDRKRCKTLNKRLSQVTLSLQSIPPETNVIFKNKLLGKTPHVLKIWWRSRIKLELKKPNYLPCVLVWKAHKNQQIRVRLIDDIGIKIKEKLPCKILNIH